MYGSAGWLFWSQLGSLMCWVSSVSKVNSSGDLGWSVPHVWGLACYCWYGMALVGTSGLSFTCSLIFQKLAWYVHMWYQSSKNAKWKYEGLLVPRLKTDTSATWYGPKQVRSLRLKCGGKAFSFSREGLHSHIAKTWTQERHHWRHLCHQSTTNSNLESVRKPRVSLVSLSQLMSLVFSGLCHECAHPLLWKETDVRPLRLSSTSL